MNRPRRRPPILAPLAVAAALLAIGASASAQTPVIHFHHETFGAFERQLASGQIRSAEFNKKPHTLHLLLADGLYALVVYPPHEEPQLAARLEAKGVPVSIEKPKAKAKAKTHHTLRYIAGGIVVIVIVIVTAVLLIDRRRKLAAGPAPPAAPSAGGEAP